MTKATQDPKPFVSFNNGHNFNDKRPKFKQSDFVIDGKLYEVAVWEKTGENGQPYLVLKLEDQVAADMRRHQYKLESSRRPEEVTEAAGTDGTDELQEVRKVVAGEKVQPQKVKVA